ncbi:MAG: DnaA/Hda family protein [Hyphomicrobiaceae bacterium]
MTDPTPRQLTFDLPHRPALGAEDFLVGASNETALAMIDSWPHWPHFAAIVEGAAQSGKTHLANVWRYRSGAETCDAVDLTEADVGRFSRAKTFVVENLDQGVGDERTLFHMLNLAREHKLSMLLTSAKSPGDLTVTLPDLRSRLRAIPLVSIGPPDDALLRAVLVKLFADRQLTVEPTVIAFVLARMERSIAAAETIVGELDSLSLATHRKVSRALAGDILARLGSPQDATDVSDS